jgi:hypothetical protein
VASAAETLYPTTLADIECEASGPQRRYGRREKRRVSVRGVEKNNAQYYSLPILRRRPLSVCTYKTVYVCEEDIIFHFRAMQNNLHIAAEATKP